MTGIIKSMKHANDTILNRTCKLPDYDAVPKTTALLLINCTIGKEITYSCATEIRIAVFTGPPIATVLRSILKVITSYFYLFKIHINTIVSSTHASSK
jgi:hypothetical protein